MNLARSSGAGLIACALALAASEVAAGPYDPPEPAPQFDPSAVETWKENDVSPPAYPDDRSLLSVPLGPRDTLKLYLDQKSLVRGADGVIRFTLAVDSSQGARNVFFEGVRCDTREFKTYAIGTPDHRLEPVKNPRWQSIRYYAANAFRYQLYKYYVCDERQQARTPNEIMRAVVQGALDE